MPTTSITSAMTEFDRLDALRRSSSDILPTPVVGDVWETSEGDQVTIINSRGGTSNEYNGKICVRGQMLTLWALNDNDINGGPRKVHEYKFNASTPGILLVRRISQSPYPWNQDQTYRTYQLIRGRLHCRVKYESVYSAVVRVGRDHPWASAPLATTNKLEDIERLPGVLCDLNVKYAGNCGASYIGFRFTDATMQDEGPHTPPNELTPGFVNYRDKVYALGVVAHLAKQAKATGERYARPSTVPGASVSEAVEVSA